MALMFQRLARNFVKNGYFPTDADTTERILSSLSIDDSTAGTLRILDPCCGEGTALAEVQAYLRDLSGSEAEESYGVEYDPDRAYHAKTLLSKVIHADLMDTVIQQRQFGLLWLNPPYGDMVADQSGAGSRWKGRKRLEKLFYERTVGTLQFGGVMVLIVPGYAFDREFATWISRNFTRVQAFSAATDRFKQVVVIGIKHRSTGAVHTETRNILTAIGNGDTEAPELPSHWIDDTYAVPLNPDAEPTFYSTKLDSVQLKCEVGRTDGLWPRFDAIFNAGIKPHRRPLRPMSRWHLALALAAGQISGKVVSDDGSQILLIKGDTHKAKQESSCVQENDDGSYTTTMTYLDRFVPVIRAIDITEGSPGFGQTLVIR